MAGGTLQQEAPPPIYPRMEVSPGERRSQLGGMILTSSQHPKAGESNPKHPTTGAIVEGAIMQGTGENQKKTKRVPPTLGGRENQEAGRKNHEAGECLLQDLGYLELEEMGDGESLFASVLVALPKVGEASLRMGLVVIIIIVVVEVEVEVEAWALGVAQAQQSRVEAGVAVSRSPLLSLQAGKNHPHLQSDVKWR